MMSDKMREEFEAWVRDRAICTPAGFYPQLSHRCILDEKRYAISWVDSAWEGWQASRSAVVIELPDAIPPDYCGQELVLTISSINEAIESAGVKCK